ncbi:MAG: alcohol dehydrogenase catalytic domain-containing protein [Pyrinomonadaceae bacterium]
MRALRYENHRLALAYVPEPRNDDEVRVRVTAAGICNTDLEIVRGYANFQGTLGHEFVGVAESGPLAGKRVVGEINVGCGHCELCLAGDSRHCLKRTVLGIVGRDGAFAEMLQLPASNLFEVSAHVSDEAAIFTEPLAAACGIVERVSTINSARRVAVIGDGKLGLLCAQALLLMTGASVTLIGKHRNKLQLAARRGIETAIVDEVTWQREFDVVIEASGSASGFQLALGLLRARGTLVLKSTFHSATEINAAPIVVNEINIVGSRCGRFKPALDLLNRRAVDVESLITEVRSFEDGVRAMERAAEPGVLKVILKMNGTN